MKTTPRSGEATSIHDFILTARAVASYAAMAKRRQLNETPRDIRERRACDVSRSSFNAICGVTLTNQRVSSEAFPPCALTVDTSRPLRSNGMYRGPLSNDREYRSGGLRKPEVLTPGKERITYDLT